MPQLSPPPSAEGHPKTVPGRLGPYEPIQNSLQDIIVKSARTGPEEGSHEPTTLTECEKKTFEIGEPEQGVLDLQQNPEKRLTLRMSESHPRSSHGASNEDLESVSKDTPRIAGSGDVLHGPEAAREMENPGPRQSPMCSQPVTPSPSALPLHLIPLLPQKSPSSRRQRRSIGQSSNQTDDGASGPGCLPNAAGGTSPSPQSLRLRLQNLSAESAGISRTLAYAIDQMDATHPPDYLPPGGAELEKPGAGEVDREGGAATRPKTVRFEENTYQPAELAERVWSDAVRAAVTARMHEESEQKMESDAQGEHDEGATCGQDAAVCEKSAAGGEREMLPEGEMQSFLRKLGTVTLGRKEERQSRDTTWVDLDLQEYIRLKEREVELRNAEAEIRTFEERLEAREKDLMSRLGTVRQRLEAIRQRRASINRQEETLRQKMEAVTKEAQSSANAPGADAPLESN
ncbi:hypothetical protein EDB92DRAFT_2116912 [Lactarius akahatsu]|uniref:Uncharacterized protein n=1 Tax=Lactarius akahatsu TaxID=416441 RepID=A0AAD4Q534_9AGAM|nr:hypothetical protein EDB92DRAFT_2116912 [Lactarius akahatsu]